MELFVGGISHKTAPVELRERLAIPEKILSDSLRALKSTSPFAESVLLSTCNRTEIYGVADSDALGWCQTFLEERLKHEKLDQYLYVKKNEEAVRHLFSVSAGLDSLVVERPRYFQAFNQCPGGNPG